MARSRCNWGQRALSDESKLKRRGFVKLCAGAAAAVGANPALLAEEGGRAKLYDRVLLVDAAGKALDAGSLAVGESYVFNYPYATTPCFLLNLGRPTVAETSLETEGGSSYVWRGGCGPQRSIVSFAAICAHKMTHPARPVSFINYRHGQVTFKDKDKQPVQRSQVIFCCSEKSVYDPTDGARVLGGPAPQPLAAILLDYDEDSGKIYATGTCGGEMYEQFFEKFGVRIALEFETSQIRRRVTDHAEVVPISEYSRSQIMCG